MKSSLPDTTSDTSRRDRVLARRRAGKLWGLAVIAAASASACFFDESTYKGGGRQDRGATAGTAPTESGGTTSVPTGTGTTPPSDAGDGDGTGDDTDAG